MPGYMYCNYCKRCIPILNGCPHMTPKPVTLNRYDAGAFYSLCKVLGIEGEPKEALEVLADLIRTGRIDFRID